MTAHSRPPHDEDDDLDLRALYRTLPRAEPGPELDASVRQAAARAVNADRQARRQRRLWHPGWGVAASIVLAACLFLVTDFEQAQVASVSEAPLAIAQAPTPPAPAPAAVASARPDAAAALQRHAPARQAERAERAAAAPAPPQAKSARVARSPSAHQDNPATERIDTDARIAQIRTLLEQGRRDAALQALEALRREAPALPLPPDLEALMRAPPR